MERDRKQSGFSLMEVLVSMALGLVILAGAVTLLRQGVDLGYMVTQRAEMQQNARVAVNLLTRDLMIAGAGLPPGGVGLPTGVNKPTVRACPENGACGNLGGYPNDTLFFVTPGNNRVNVNATATDVLTLAFVDNLLRVGQSLEDVDANNSGTQLTVGTADVAAINDPVTGLKRGDIMVLQNSNGVALGIVTQDVSGGTNKVKMDPGANDKLNINYAAGSASGGNIAALRNPNPPTGNGQYPPTSATRIQLVSYFIDTSNASGPRLMRQVNQAPAVAVALNIENVQITYDVTNTATGVSRSNLDDPLTAVPPASPNDIRKVNLAVTAQAPVQGLFRRGFERITLTTSVSVRNLGWFDRYQ